MQPDWYVPPTKEAPDKYLTYTRWGKPDGGTFIGFTLNNELVIGRGHKRWNLGYLDNLAVASWEVNPETEKT